MQEYECYRRLAHEVVVMAIEDYRKAIRIMKKYDGQVIEPEDRPKDLIWAEKIIPDCEKFFKGQLISVYCDFDGPRIMNLVRKQEKWNK